MTTTLEPMLHIEEVCKVTGLSRNSIYVGMRAGTFPRGKLVGSKARRWPETEIREWLDGLPD